MPVPPAQRAAERSNVEDELMSLGVPSASHHDEPPVSEQPGGSHRWRSRLESLNSLYPLSSEEQKGLGCGFRGSPRVVGPTEKCGCCRKNASHIIRRPGVERQKPPAVSVSDQRHGAGRAADGEEKVKHPLESLPNGRWDRHSIPCRQDQEVEVDLHRVPLVASGLLEIDAIRKDLPLDLVRQDSHSQLAPTPSRPQLRKHDPRVEEAESLSREMSVRRKVIREVLFYVRSMGLDPVEHLDKQLRGQHR